MPFTSKTALPFAVLVIWAATASPGAAGPIVVQSALGGTIIGYDVDRTGTMGVLSEYLPDGDANDIAVETFDLTTGAIVKIAKQKTGTKNDYVVLGVVGAGAGLVETEHVGDLFVNKRTYNVIDPLKRGRFTGKWTPPLSKDDILLSASVNTGASTTALMGFPNTGSGHTFVFASDVAGNTFGPKFEIDDDVFDFNDSPVMAYDGQTNKAFVGASVGCNPSCFGELRSVDMATGEVSDAVRVGHGFVNGIAVDEAHGIIATTTELDFTVEFYNENTHGIVRTVLQGATSQANSGADVQYDPTHKLFLVGQPFSSTGPNSSIQVYDHKGVFVESIDNLHLPASAVRIALDPAHRRGFVQSSQNGSQLQIFSY